MPPQSDEFTLRCTAKRAPLRSPPGSVTGPALKKLGAIDDLTEGDTNILRERIGVRLVKDVHPVVGRIAEDGAGARPKGTIKTMQATLRISHHHVVLQVLERIGGQCCTGRGVGEIR